MDAVATTDVVADPAGCLGEDVPTLLVSLARSGDSPESVAAVRLADHLLSRVRHLVLTCNPDGQLAREYSVGKDAQVMQMPDGANDQGFAMTSSFTSMVLAAQLVLGSGHAGNLADRVADIAEAVFEPWQSATRQLTERTYQRVVYLGSGALHGLAKESALKLLELTAGRVVGLAGSPLGFRHGPKAVVDDDTLVVVYVSNDSYTRAYDLDLLDELRSWRGEQHVLAVTADHDDRISASTPWMLPGAAELNDAALALPAVLFAQHFALHSSTALGLTADNPFPGGEVNRVVQGVRIHGFDRSR